MGENIICIFFFFFLSLASSWLLFSISDKECFVHISGFVACTATNPIWFVKTRLQLDHQTNRISALECVRRIYQQSVSLFSTLMYYFLHLYALYLFVDHETLQIELLAVVQIKPPGYKKSHSIAVILSR